MDYKKSKAPTNTVTHNLMDFAKVQTISTKA